MSLEDVLCMACGYQLKSRPRGQLAEQSDAAASNENATASPDGPADSILSEEAEGRAESIIASANSLNAKTAAGLCLLLLVFGVCTPLWLLVLPWSTYHYLRWRRLHWQFAALQRATSYSPYGDVAARFQAAGSELRLCIAVGAIPWVVLAAFISFRVLSAALAPT